MLLHDLEQFIPPPHYKIKSGVTSDPLQAAPSGQVP